MSGFTSLNAGGSGGSNGGGGASTTGPFGSPLFSQLTPTGQSTFVYGVNPTTWITQSNGTGAGVTVSENIMSCASGNSISGSAFVRLSRGLKYRAGQGSICRLTSIFEPGQTDTLQLAGVGNKECGFYFAKKNSNFGILHRETSKLEIRKLTITAAGGTETVTVTLNGYVKSFQITGGSDINQTSYAISQGDYSQIGSGWAAEAIDGTIYFISEVPGPFSGAFSFSSGGTATGTFTTVQVGSLPVDTFISQSNWNLDRFDGTGESRARLDTSKGNIYSIGYQYLGFGDATFAIEDPETGTFTNVHRIQAAGARTSTVIKNPYMYARWAVMNSGSLASNVTIKGASAATFIEGQINRSIGPAFSTSGSLASITTDVKPVLSIRVNKVFNNACNYGEVEIFNLSVGNDAGASGVNKLMFVYVYKNAGLGGPVNFTYADSTKSIVAYDRSATSLTINSGTQLLKSFVVGPDASTILALHDENFHLVNGETMTIAAKSVKTTIDSCQASLSWFEDQ